MAIVSGTFEEPKQPVNFKVERFVGNIAVEEDPSLPTLGRHQTVGGVCFIKLQRYPVCMQHEMRHCIEGDWHKGVKSSKDCYE